MKHAIGLLILIALARPVWGASAIGVYFDARGNAQSREVAVGESFSFYVLADGVSAGLKAYEFALDIDPRIQVFGRTLHGSHSFDVGSGPDNWVVGTGVCEDDSPLILVEYSAMLVTESAGLFISVEPSSPSSSLSGQPAYVPCESTTIYDFEEVSGALVNPDQQSWGAVKHLYE